MLNLFNLIKINFFGAFKISNSSNFSYLKYALFLSLYFLLGFFIYRLANYMAAPFYALGEPSLILSEFFAFGSILVLALSVFRMDIFNSKDHDLLASLPISKKTIIASKLINLYLFNFLILFLIMIPAYIAYINVTTISFAFIIMSILSLFIIPIIPTTIAVFLNSIITIIATRFKYKKLAQTILMILLMVFSIYFAYKMDNNLELNLLDISGSFNNFFNKFYPLTKYYINMLINNDFKSLIIFIGISLLSIILLIIFLSLFYDLVNNKIASKANHRFSYKSIANHNYFTNLIKKDIKRVFYSPNFLLNSCLGLILLILIPIILSFINIDSIENTPITKDMLINNLYIVFLFLILLSSTTSSLISLEGKNFYILKMLPSKFSSVWLAKILSNFILILISSFISLIIFNISFDVSFNINIKTILIILTSGLFISLYGLVVNLLFPLLSWKSEIKVIKQSAASFITIFSGLLIGIFLLSNDFRADPNYIYYVSIGFLMFSSLLIIFLNTIGKKIYENIPC